MPTGENTLQSILEKRLLEEPEEIACELVQEGGDAVPVTVGRMMGRAMAIARRLGGPRGERRVVGVCLYHGLDLHAAFLGALWAGHIPTMLAPPSPRMERAKYAGAFSRMIQHIGPSQVIVDSGTVERLSEESVDVLERVEIVDPCEATDDAPLEAVRPDPGEVAVLQHSSGTTGLQKGIALSHSAILEHNRVYAKTLGITRQDVIVSWLPLYHDMGFVACFLLPLLRCIRFVEISPFHWVKKPQVLLEEISRARGTLCWLPNFAFQFLADNAASVAGDLDLSTVRAFVNCSEPVSQHSIRAFVDRFRVNGVTEQQITASYAMAENVFAVTQSQPGLTKTLWVEARPFAEEHRVVLATDGGLPFVSNGPTIEGSEIEVLDGEDQALPEDRVGELAIRGTCRFSGYHGRDDLTSAAMTEDGWYRTGDLGFVHDGQVYVTGRKKDLIIVQGRNFYPTDIERVVLEVPGVIPGRTVAFGVWNERSGTEDLVILAESDVDGPERKRLALKVRGQVAQSLDCTPADVRIVPARWLVKSTSGKLARGDNRDKYLSMLLNPPR